MFYKIHTTFFSILKPQYPLMQHLTSDTIKYCINEHCLKYIVICII